MKTTYQKPVVEIWDLNAMNLMENQIGVHSKILNQNPTDNTEEEGAFAKEGFLMAGWGSDAPAPRSLWED